MDPPPMMSWALDVVHICTCRCAHVLSPPSLEFAPPEHRIVKELCLVDSLPTDAPGLELFS